MCSASEGSNVEGEEILQVIDSKECECDVQCLGSKQRGGIKKYYK